MTTKIKDILRYLKTLIFPKRCIFCDSVLPFSKKELYICNICKENIEFIGKNHCHKCGAKIGNETSLYCSSCIEKDKINKSNFIYGLGLCRYNDATKESIHRLKYLNRPEYAEFYGKMIAKILFDDILKMKIDCFVPVPIHKNRLIKRGYNQAELIANSISEYLKNKNIRIEVNNNILFRRNNTNSLNKLDASDRLKELNNAFYSSNTSNINSVCIIDDIYTTGATIETCARCLKDSGINEIYFITIAVVDNM